jgi:hypothetical protein
MPVYPGVSMIRLTVADLSRARAFYERLGWRLSTTASSSDYACFALNNIALTLEARPLRGAAETPALTLIQCHGGPRAVAAASRIWRVMCGSSHAIPTSNLATMAQWLCRPEIARPAGGVASPGARGRGRIC